MKYLSRGIIETKIFGANTISHIGLKCKEARFIGPNEMCYKTGGLYCNRYNTIVGKYDQCLEKNKDQDKTKKPRKIWT